MTSSNFPLMHFLKPNTSADFAIVHYNTASINEFLFSPKTDRQNLANINLDECQGFDNKYLTKDYKMEKKCESLRKVLD